jgi:phosphoribosyl-ATP pyrophosphohydrolase/phosphoribosyl-AMP cyclohydrolase
MKLEEKNLNFEKSNGLVPAIVQNALTQKVLMLGYMNKEALEQTLETGLVTFYSRTKSRLWMKGEASGNTLAVKDIFVDCDNDTLLVQVEPAGPTCHTGDVSCFGETGVGISFLSNLESIIKERKELGAEGSYTSSLFEQGLPRIAQKVGEEGTEVVIAALAESDTVLKEESADLLFHLLVLLREKNISLMDVIAVLSKRHSVKNAGMEK